MTIIRLAWVKFTEAPMGPSAGSSLNWLSASIDPPAATCRPLSYFAQSGVAQSRVA